jgi:polysaccharide export outer membrane protein
MNLLFPRYRKQRRRNGRNYPACGWLRAFSRSAVFAILWIGALGYPGLARAQNDAPGSQPAVIPAPAAPASEPRAQNPPKAEPPKVDAATPQTQAAEIQKVDDPKAAAPKAGTASAGGKAYIIGPNDVLQVSVWNQPQISKIVDVHLDGMISIQLAGEIKAEGRTALQLSEAITRRLEEVALTAPVVDVSVLKINSKHYRVYGGVLRGGEFVLAERTTIMDALSLTGFKDFAKQKKIELRRDNGKEKFLFNYPDFIKGKNTDKNINRELQDGDEIIVPE